MRTPAIQRRAYILAATMFLFVAPPSDVDAQGLGPIETSNRVAVRNAFNQYYRQPMPAMGWTGSISSCDAGTIAPSFKEWTILRVNFIRAIAGLPGNITLNETNSAKAQKAALMMAANRQLSHFPPTTWSCYSAEGAEAAGKSNLAGGQDDVVPLYIDDGGSNNVSVGHRRWILYPPQTNMGVGSTAGYNALWVLAGFGARPQTPDGTPWPSRGFVPLALFPSSQRWSFSFPNANFSASNVSMMANGVPVTVTVISRTDNGFGDNTIVWVPTLTVSKGAVYDVSITGVSGAGVPTSFAYKVRPFDPADPYTVRADFNGDGRAEILWRNTSSGDNAIWQVNGVSLAASSLIAQVAEVAWRIAATGDFDGDGKADILWHNNSTGDTAVWLMNALTLSASALLSRVADAAWKIVGTGDFDGDGKADILWRNTVTGDNAIWFMNGVNVASTVLIPSVPEGNWTIAGVGDFNSDGKADILWRNASTGDTAVWLMKSSTLTASALVQSVPTAWVIAGVGDYDGDGTADILWRNPTTGENAIWLMSGLTRSSGALINGVPDGNWTIVGTGDYDGDGKADILWRNTSTGDNAIWLMNGFILQSSALINSVPDANWTIVRQ